MSALEFLLGPLGRWHERHLLRQVDNPTKRELRRQEREEREDFEHALASDLRLLDTRRLHLPYLDQVIRFVHHSAAETGPATLTADQVRCVRDALDQVSSLPAATEEDTKISSENNRRGHYAGLLLADPYRDRPAEYSTFDSLPNVKEQFHVGGGFIERVRVLNSGEDVTYYKDSGRQVERQLLSIFLSYPGPKDKYERLSGDKLNIPDSQDA